jgi:hypothetical protein
MKLKGLNISERPYDEAQFDVLGQKVTFRAKVVSDYSDFKAAVPEPQPPVTVDRTGVKTKNPRHPDYIKKMEKYNEQQTVFMLMDSLSATPDLEWTLLDLAEPTTLTFDNLQEEFTSAGFPLATTSKIINLASAANGLTERIVDSARESFTPEALPEQSELDFQEGEANATQSGVLAPASE